MKQSKVLCIGEAGHAGARKEDGGRAGRKSLSDRQTQGSEPKQMAGPGPLCVLDTAAVSLDYFWPLEEALGDLNDHIRQQ